MYNLPKQITKPSYKSPNRSYLSNQTQFRKRTNINNIKQEIQFILKRNNSPLSLHIQRQILRTQKNIHSHLLQRKRSKILQRANQQNIQKAKINRKLYEQYLIGDISAKSYNKSQQNNKSLPKYSIQTLNMKQTSYAKQLLSNRQLPINKKNLTIYRDLSLNNRESTFNRDSSLNKRDSSLTNRDSQLNNRDSSSLSRQHQIKDLSTSKSNFNTYKTISYQQKQPKPENMFTQKQIQHLKLGKILFYKDSNLKIKRSNLLKGQPVTQRHNLFKQTPIQSFYNQPNFDLIKYLKHYNKVNNQKNKIDQQQSHLKKERSLQICKKQIIPKKTLIEPFYISNNPQQTKINKQQDFTTSKYQNKFQISPHFQNLKSQIPNQTLNVMDQQLLVYYGKLKNKKPNTNIEYHRQSLNKSQFRKPSNQTHNMSKILDINVKTSVQIKKPMKKQHSWRFNNLDPWEKLKFDDQIDHQNVFSNFNHQNNNSQQIQTINSHSQQLS